MEIWKAKVETAHKTTVQFSGNTSRFESSVPYGRRYIGTQGAAGQDGRNY